MTGRGVPGAPTGPRRAARVPDVFSPPQTFPHAAACVNQKASAALRIDEAGRFRDPTKRDFPHTGMNRRTAASLAFFLALSANGSRAYAAVIAEESFSYAAGQSLGTQNGGTGWAGA